MYTRLDHSGLKFKKVTHLAAQLTKVGSWESWWIDYHKALIAYSRVAQAERRAGEHVYFLLHVIQYDHVQILYDLISC